MEHTNTILRARLLPEDARRLLELASAPRLHRSLPPSHPRRAASAELSALLSALLARGVPAAVLGQLLGVTHQAVRQRAAPSPSPCPRADPRMLDALFAEVAPGPSPGLLMLSDTGSFRRVLVQASPPVGYALRPLPALRPAPAAPPLPLLLQWLESRDPARPHLRAVPAVLVPQSLVHAVLEPLPPVRTPEVPA